MSEFDEQMKRAVEGAASDELLQSLLLIPAPLYSLPSITHPVIPGKLEWSDKILTYGYGFKSVLSSPYIVTGILDNNLSSTQYHFSVYVYQSIHYFFFSETAVSSTEWPEYLALVRSDANIQKASQSRRNSGKNKEVKGSADWTNEEPPSP